MFFCFFCLFIEGKEYLSVGESVAGLLLLIAFIVWQFDNFINYFVLGFVEWI